MYNSFWLFITFLLTFTNRSFTEQFFIDLKEIEGTQYDILITGDPVVFDGEKVVSGDNTSLGEDGEEIDTKDTTPEEKSDIQDSTEHHVTMLNKLGQKYHCSLPLLHDESNYASDESSSTENSDQQSTEIKRNSKVTDVKELLGVMEGQPCLIKTKDWWSYEFCYGSEIRQYHMEDMKPSGAILKLGQYDHDYDWSQGEESSDIIENSSHFQKLRSLKQSGIKGRPKYHSQFYVNGSACDLTGELRKTEVRFQCDPSALTDIITRIDEPQSCEYIVMVTTKKICSIPQFRPPVIEKPKQIKCSPVFTQHEYDKWTSYQKVKKDIAKRKMAEAQERSKKEMLNSLEGEDVSHIDIDTDEGLAQIESMVGDKMAKKLIDSIGDILGTSSTKKPKEGKDTLTTIEEIILPSGEKQSRITESTKVNDDTIEVRTKTSISNPNKSPEEDEEEEDDISKKKPTKSEITRKIKAVSDKMTKMLQGDVNNKATNENTQPEGNTISLDPRSDLSDERELLNELENTVLKLTGRQFQNTQGDMTGNMPPKESPTSSSTPGVLKTTEDMKTLKTMVKKHVEDSLEDIIEETEDEMNLKLDGVERSKAIQEMSSTFENIMNKLDKVEASMDRVQEELAKTDQLISNKEDKLNLLKGLKKLNELEKVAKEIDEEKWSLINGLDSLNDEETEELNSQWDKWTQEREKNKNSIDVKEDISSQKNGDQKDDTKIIIAETLEEAASADGKQAATSSIKIATATVKAESANIRGLENTESEKRVVKHLESAIKEKLSQSGFDTGGRQIEVKVITANGLPVGTRSKMFGSKALKGKGGVSSLIGEALGLVGGGEGNEEDDDDDNDVVTGSDEEEKQLQNMMYNLMIGNQDGFNDIDNQRKSENNYRFSFDDQLKTQQELLAKEEELEFSSNTDESISEAPSLSENEPNQQQEEEVQMKKQQM